MKEAMRKIGFVISQHRHSASIMFPFPLPKAKYLIFCGSAPDILTVQASNSCNWELHTEKQLGMRLLFVYNFLFCFAFLIRDKMDDFLSHPVSVQLPLHFCLPRSSSCIK